MQSVWKKSDVNGENELPLYTYLKAQKGFARFEPTVDMAKVEDCIKTLL